MSRRLPLIVVLLLAVAAGIWFAMRDAGGLARPDQRAEAVFASRLPDLKGVKQDLSAHRGKVMVINFWASWCAPCIEEIPGFTRLQDKYRDRGVVFVGVAIDEPDAVQPFVQKLGINYSVLTAEMAGYELLRAAGDDKGVMPFTLVIGADGKVAGSRAGIFRETELDQTLASLI